MEEFCSNGSWFSNARGTRNGEDRRVGGCDIALDESFMKDFARIATI